MKFKKIDLEQQYKSFLQKMALNESKMHSQQKIQIKQTFYGAFGQAIMVMRDEVSEQDENAAVESLQNMMEQIQDFFLSETKRQN